MRAAAEYLARFERMHPRSIDLSLARVYRLLAAIGAPQDALPPVIHVAGTNGKGSTVAFLRAMHGAAGRRVHVFTSPHLIRFNERIVLGDDADGAPIDDGALAALLERVDTANGDAPITFFEITTAAALLAFAETPADVVLLETGLGGRLDATNVVVRPAATVITPISIDHTGFLGTSIAAIAGEKAGILKRHTPAIVGPQTPDATGVIAARARTVGAPVFAYGEAWHCGEQHGRLVYQDDRGLLDLPLPRLVGAHQIVNAGAAIAATRFADSLPVKETALAAGLTGAYWPARLERLEPGALTELAPNAEIWLDGGHNPGAAEVLARTLADLQDRVPKPLHLIVGMLATKDAGGFLRAFTGLARALTAVPIPGNASALTATELAAVAAGVNIPADMADTCEAALLRIAAQGEPVRVLITGSLYLAGRVIEAHRGGLARPIA